MTAYRFCRTDDIALLVEAYEGCRGPEDGGEPPLDRAGFKALIREQDLWCSSCMVALEGRRPVGVLLGAKRAESTLVLALRVHPEHRRRGHGRHLLASLGQKLAILGPPRLVAEVPAEREAARALFAACGWNLEGRLLDWRRPAGAGAGPLDAPLVPATVEEAVASGLLRPACRAWSRDLAALARRGEAVIGLAAHSGERLEAVAFAVPAATDLQVLAAGHAESELGRLGLRLLFAELERRAPGGLRCPRLAPGELDAGLLADLGFRPGTEHLRFATAARAA
jgi:GNAT superfamily N-acetyltransferase